MKKLLLSIIFIFASAYQAFCGGPSVFITANPNSLFFTAPVSTTTGMQYVTVTGVNNSGSSFQVTVTGTASFTPSPSVINVSSAVPFMSVVGVSFTSGASSNTKLTGSLTFTSSAWIDSKQVSLYGGVLPSSMSSSCTVNIYSDNNTVTGVGSISGTAGIGDLRYCISLANNAITPATINFSGAGTTSLKANLPDLNNSISFIALGGTTISGASQFYIFKNSIGYSLSAQSLTFVNAYSSGAGSVINNVDNSGALGLTNCSFYNNTSSGTGGAIYTANRGATNLLNKCIFSGNYSGNSGASVYSYDGNLVVSNSVFTSNNGNGGGGNVLHANDGTLKIVSSTFYANSGTGNSVLRSDVPTIIINSTMYNNSTTGTYGGLYLNTYYKSTLINNIIVNNSTTGYGDIEAADISSLSGHNIITASFTGLSDGLNGNIVNPTIGGALFSVGLTYEGGTYVLPINQSSIALNKGLTTSTTPGLVIPTTDQKGLPNFNAKDIGAYEFQGLNQGIYNFGPFSSVPFSPNYVITVAGVSDSGLPVFYSVLGPANVSGNKINITGIGVVTITAFQPGNSTYKSVTVSLSFSVVASTLTGISNGASSNSYSIYPNPSAGSFTVDTGEEPVSITVYNTTGEIVQSTVSSPGVIKIVLASKGLYFVGIASKVATVYKKVILE